MRRYLECENGKVHCLNAASGTGYPSIGVSAPCAAAMRPILTLMSRTATRAAFTHANGCLMFGLQYDSK